MSSKRLTMSISGALLVAITASFFKPLLSANQSQHVQPVAAYNHYKDISPFEENELPPDSATNFFLTLRLPQLLSSGNADFDIKRQFDPWGGKRYSKAMKDEDLSRKRQFSPWGGKRSDLENLFLDEKDNAFPNTDAQATDSSLVEIKRGYLSLNTKRGFNSWGGKRNSKENDAVKRIKSWDGERNVKSWGKKRNFKPWGGKRFIADSKESSDIVFEMNKNANSGGKRQAFHSWGGKRGFNSWGGKRAFSSWGGKRGVSSKSGKRDFSSWGGKRAMYNNEIKTKEDNNSDDDDDDSAFFSYNAVTDGTEKYLR